MSRLENILNEIEFDAVRSRGPGGQNVNKVSSAAVLTWNVWLTSALTPEDRQRVQDKLANWINRDGILQVRSDEFRDLGQNKRRCIEKLEELLKIAFHRPKPRRATKPTRGSQERRHESKKRRGQTKQTRSKVKY